jgi:cytochrome c-type biogenesis protein CcmH/NrfF
VLVTLLVLWVIVVPTLTVAGSYLLVGILRRRAHARPDQLDALAPTRLAPLGVHHSPVGWRTHARRPRGDVIARH